MPARGGVHSDVPAEENHALLASFKLKDAGAVLTLSAAAVRVTASALRPFSAFPPIHLPPALAQSPFIISAQAALRAGSSNQAVPSTPDSTGPTALLCVVSELLGAVVDSKNKSLLSIIVCHEEAIPCVPAHGPQVTHTHLLRRQTVECASPAEALAACDALRTLARAGTRRILVVVNPHSGDGSANSTARAHVVPLLRSAGIAVDVRLTRYSLHAHAMGLALALSNGLTTDTALVDAALRHAHAAGVSPASASAAGLTSRSTSPTRARSAAGAPASPSSGSAAGAAAPPAAATEATASANVIPLSPVAGVPLVSVPDGVGASCCANMNAWCAARISAMITTLLDSSDPVPLPPAFPVGARTAATGYPAPKLCAVPYDGCVVVGGDGTVHELVSGMLEGMRTRGRAASGTTPASAAAPAMPPVGMADRFHVNAFMPIAALPCGTSNALSLGMGTAGTVSACFTVIKRRLRPLDGIEVSNADGVTRVALCGVGWGIPGAIAADSEAWRPLGRARYAFLKVKHGTAAGLGLVTYEATLSHSMDTRYRRVHGLAGTHGWHNYGAPATVTQEALVALPAVEAPADGLVPPSASASAASDGTESSPDSPIADAVGSSAAQPQHPIVLPEETAAAVLRNVSTRGRERELAAADVIIALPASNSGAAGAAPAVAAAAASNTAPSTPRSSRRARSRTGSAPFIDLESCGRDCTQCVKYLLNPMETAREVSARSSVPPSVEHGAFVTVGIINTVPDARFCHASDGLLDVIIARKGEFIDTAGLLMRYFGSNMGVADERNSVLYSYVRARSAMLEPAGDSAAVVCNVDGEVFPGPSPFRFCVLPQYLVMFGL